MRFHLLASDHLFAVYGFNAELCGYFVEVLRGLGKIDVIAEYRP